MTEPRYPTPYTICLASKTKEQCNKEFPMPGKYDGGKRRRKSRRQTKSKRARKTKRRR